MDQAQVVMRPPARQRFAGSLLAAGIPGSRGPEVVGASILPACQAQPVDPDAHAAWPARLFEPTRQTSAHSGRCGTSAGDDPSFYRPFLCFVDAAGCHYTCSSRGQKRKDGIRLLLPQRLRAYGRRAASFMGTRKNIPNRDAVLCKGYGGRNHDARERSSAGKRFSGT